MFFSRTQKTFLRNPAKVGIFQPRNGHFWLLKHAFFIPTSYTDIHKHIWIQNTNKKTSKHQNQAWGTKSRRQQLNTAYIFMQHGLKFGFLNPFCAWTGITKLR